MYFSNHAAFLSTIQRPSKIRKHLSKATSPSMTLNDHSATTAASISLALARLTVSSCLPLIVFFCGIKEQQAEVASCVRLCHRGADWSGSCRCSPLTLLANGISGDPTVPAALNVYPRISAEESIQVVSDAHGAQPGTII